MMADKKPISIILSEAIKRGTELGDKFDDKFIILGPNKETEEALTLAIKEKVLMTAKIKGD